MSIKSYEKIQFITPDGLVFNLHSPPNQVVSEIVGDGLSPFSIYSTRGPFDNFEEVSAVKLNTRQISLKIRKNGKSRSAYWANRSSLIDYFRVNRTNLNYPVSGILRRIYLVDNVKTVRDIDVYMTEGLTYNILPGWQEWAIEESLMFEAKNPIHYDPTVISSVCDAFTESLILPFTFPFVLGSQVCYSNITYAGTWKSSPTIVINGPTNGIYIKNNSTGNFIGLNYNLPLGEIITIDTTNRTIKDNFGTDLIGYLFNGSDITNFNLQPNPIVAGGVNQIFTVVNNYMDGSTQVSFNYYNRYIGI